MARYALYYHYTLTDVDGISVTVDVPNLFASDTLTLAALATTSGTLNTLLAALTNAKVTQRSVSFLLDKAQGVGTDAEFPLVSQKAVAHFANAAGSKAQISIPAPKEAIFRAPPSDDIIDPSQADMAAFITSYEGIATDHAGNFFNLFLGGGLSTRRRSRKRSIRS